MYTSIYIYVCVYISTSIYIDTYIYTCTYKFVYIGFIINAELGISRTNAASQWNLVYNTFIEFFLVDMSQLISSNPNVIHIWKKCGQRLGMAAASKRRALGFFFQCEFATSKRRRESNLGLCTTSGLAKRICKKNVTARCRLLIKKHDWPRKSALHSGIIFASLKLCTDLNWTLLYIVIYRAYTKFVWEKMLALGPAAFASRCPARALAADQDHVYIATEQLFCFHQNEFLLNAL